MRIRDIPVKLLEGACSIINRKDIKSLVSYKRTVNFLKNLGYVCPEIEYVESYYIDGICIDKFSFLEDNLLVYSTSNDIIGCKIRNANYNTKRILYSILKDSRVYETKDYTVYERTA